MRISVITLALDMPPYIDEAIASVARPGGIEIEHLIIHDGSAADADALARRFPSVRVMRGSGRGATAAANAAIKHATGEFIFFLNSDDRLSPQAVPALIRAAAGSPEVEVWTGGTRIFTKAADDREITLRVLTDPASTALTLANALDDLPLLTARFIRRDVYERLGAFDEYFHTCSDRDLMIRLALAGVDEAPLNAPVSELRLHEESATVRVPRSRVPDYLPQHVELARRWLGNPALPPQQRALFRDWHARELMRLVFYSLSSGKVRQALRIHGSGYRVDPIWPWRARTALHALRLRRRNDMPVT